MFRRITEGQLRGVTLSAYRKFRLVLVGREDGPDLYVRPLVLPRVGAGHMTDRPLACNTLLIEVADPLDADTQRRVMAWVVPAAN